MTTTTLERDRRDTTPVLVAGAGLVGWNVLTWLAAAQRLGVRFDAEGDTLQVAPGLPPVAQEFVHTHAAELQRVLRATPLALM